MTDRCERLGEWDATWEGARRQLHESILAATPLQRLEWLEEALELAYLAGALGCPPVKVG